MRLKHILNRTRQAKQIIRKVKCGIYVFFICFILVLVAEERVFVTGNSQQKIPLLIGVVGKDRELNELAAIIKKDLCFSRQFSVDITIFKKKPAKKTVKKLFKQGYLLAIFINFDNSKNSVIEWRLYDTAQAMMVQGKKYTKQESYLGGWAHNITDMIWPVLTGQEGFFSSKIAYCKEILTKAGGVTKHICVADYDGSNEQVIVNSPTVNIAPRWNKDITNPLLFYSEHTNTNVRLMVVDTKKKSHIASNFDGINMLPTFSKDGKTVIYCASRGDGSCQLYQYEKNKLKRLTNNMGNNISPSFGDNEIIYFCSDFQTKKPQIYAYNLQKNEFQQLTEGGYCTSPDYCAKTGKLVYTKMVNGLMQLFIYDSKTKNHTQLTVDAGNKHECIWSPCGNYILFATDYAYKSRIAFLSLLTKERRFLTPADKSCDYPSWSLCFKVFPIFS
ncbi:MAG: hypothetical protein WCD44_02295 [Candidatus Babeliales bacterium]